MSDLCDLNDEGDRVSFSLLAEFQAVTPTAGLSLGPLELQYQELFAEALEDGVITPEERARLSRAAANLNLDYSRLEPLEQAMTAAYESHHRVRVVDQTLAPNTTLAPLFSRGARAAFPAGPVASAPPPLATPKLQSTELDELRAENAALRARIQLLEAEVVRAQSEVNVEVDLREGPAVESNADSPEEAWKRASRNPTDPAAQRALRAAYQFAGNADGSYLAAKVLVSLGAANPEEAALVERHRPRGLIAPRASIDEATWRSCLFHHEQDAVTGGIFAVIAPAILVGRVTTLRRDGQLYTPSPAQKQDPSSSTIMAVRAVGWAAALVGLAPPQVFASPDSQAGYVHVAGLPPVSVLGAQVLSGRSIIELAFSVGHHISGYRGEHFVRTLFSGTEDLEDLFLAALFISNPQLPLRGVKRSQVESLARAIEPLLDTGRLDTLRGHYLRFAEEGGRTNLHRWSTAVEKTSSRVGLALCQDLPTALKMLEPVEGVMGPMTLDLLSYSTSSKFLALRTTLGISVTAE